MSMPSLTSVPTGANGDGISGFFPGGCLEPLRQWLGAEGPGPLSLRVSSRRSNRGCPEVVQGPSVSALAGAPCAGTPVQMQRAALAVGGTAGGPCAGAPMCMHTACASMMGLAGMARPPAGMNVNARAFAPRVMGVAGSPVGMNANARAFVPVVARA